MPISKVDIIDKYSPRLEVAKKIITRYYCKAGDNIEIVSKDPGEWMIVVIVKNNKGQSFKMQYNDIEFDTDFNFDEDFNFEL